MSKIKTLRERQGLTQAEFSSLIGEKRTTVAMWEVGKFNPVAVKLPKVAKALGVTIDELLTEDEG